MRSNFTWTVLFTMLVGGLGLGAVGTAQPFFNNHSVQAMEAEKSPQLQGTTWYISGWEQATALGTNPITLEFTDSRLSGTAGCNNFSGGYTVSGGSLTVGEALAMTRKACAEEIMAQEQRFMELLSQVQSYDIGNDGTLTLTYENDGEEGTISFIPASQYSVLHNSQWQLVTMAGFAPLPSEGTGSLPSIEFIGDRLAGTGGCNRLMGKFTVDGDMLTIDERMASTMMACPEPLMIQEQAFISALTAAQKYEILTTGELVIDYLNDGETKQLVFKSSPTADGQSQGDNEDTSSPG